DVLPAPVKLRPGTAPAKEILVLPVTGPQGPPGPPGTGTANPYVHTQSAPAGTWSITHNLGRIPQVTVLNDNNEVVIADITHSSNNALSIVFASPQSEIGRAHV